MPPLPPLLHPKSAKTDSLHPSCLNGKAEGYPFNYEQDNRSAGGSIYLLRTYYPVRDRSVKAGSEAGQLIRTIAAGVKNPLKCPITLYTFPLLSYDNVINFPRSSLKTSW